MQNEENLLEYLFYYTFSPQTKIRKKTDSFVYLPKYVNTDCQSFSRQSYINPIIIKQNPLLGTFIVIVGIDISSSWSHIWYFKWHIVFYVFGFTFRNTSPRSSELIRATTNKLFIFSSLYVLNKSYVSCIQMLKT